MKRKIRDNDEMAKTLDIPDKDKFWDTVCGWAMLMSMKVRDSNK